MPTDSNTVATPAPTTRSAVTNGSQLFVQDLDGRTALARRYRDLVHAFTSDIGGDPSEAMKQLIRRASSLSTWCEAQEVKLANGEEIEIGPLTTAANSLRRLLIDIGLERRSKDITPGVGQYLADRAAQRQASASVTAPESARGHSDDEAGE